MCLYSQAYDTKLDIIKRESEVSSKRTFPMLDEWRLVQTW